MISINLFKIQGVQNICVAQILIFILFFEFYLQKKKNAVSFKKTTIQKKITGSTGWYIDIDDMHKLRGFI